MEGDGSSREREKRESEVRYRGSKSGRGWTSVKKASGSEIRPSDISNRNRIVDHEGLGGGGRHWRSLEGGSDVDPLEK